MSLISSKNQQILIHNKFISTICLHRLLLQMAYNLMEGYIYSREKKVILI